GREAAAGNSKTANVSHLLAAGRAKAFERGGVAVLNDKLLVHSPRPGIESDNNQIAAAVVGRHIDAAGRIVSGRDASCARPNPMSELAKHIAPNIDSRAVDERSGIIGHDPPPQIR